MKKYALFLTVFCVSSFLFFFQLGERPLRNPDEGRYAQISKEMVERGDWVEPRLYGIDYLKKPILFYWLIALSFKCFGFTEWAARLVPALFGLAGVLATFWFARRLFGEKIAFWSALILTTNFMYLQVGRYVVIDMVFSFFVVVALYAFYLALTETRRSAWYAAAFYVCIALAFLAKGFIGLLIPFITIALYALSTRQIRKVLSKAHFLTGLGIFLLVVSPWMIEMTKREPEFLSFFFFNENLRRFVSSKFEHQQPWYFYYSFLLVIFIPWIFFFRPFKHAFNLSDPETRNRKIFLWISGTALVVFFSLSKSKLATYILPATPFLSILIAQGWEAWRLEGFNAHSKKRAMISLSPLVVVSAVFLAGLGVVARHTSNDFVHDTLPSLLWLAAVILTGGAAGIFWVARGSVDKLFYTIIVMFIAATFPVQEAMERSNVNYTSKHMAETLKPLIKENDLVVILGNPGPVYDFRFYMDSPVQVVGLEGELESSKKDKHVEKAYIPKDDFSRVLSERKRVYGMTRIKELNNVSSDLRALMTTIKEDRRKILFRLDAPA